MIGRVSLPTRLTRHQYQHIEPNTVHLELASVRFNLHHYQSSQPEPETDTYTPSVGDQHRSGAGSIIMPNSTTTTANPFEEPQRRMNEYTAQEIATLQARLDKKLGPEYISARPGAAGQKVHYLSADKCINLANEVFGFNGWSSSIQTIQIDFVRLFRTFGMMKGSTDAQQSGRGEPEYRQDQLRTFGDYESHTPGWDVS